MDDTLLRTNAPETEREHGHVQAHVVQIGDEEFIIVSTNIDFASCFQGLTRAERDVAQQLLLGASNKDIAERRGTSVRTVANQIAAIYRKLDVYSRAELMVYVHAAREPRLDDGTN